MSHHLPEAIRELTTLQLVGGDAVGSERPLVDADFDLKACERLMRGGSKTFFAASLVLPSRVRAPATALYAFCRLADDTIDIHSADHGGPAGAIAHLHDRLRRIYAGKPLPVDADKALAAVVARFHLPQALLLALLDGFEWDMADRRYETLADLHAYGARVAGTVGAMMAVIMGTRSPRALARACELGVAMQLTNIARDVGEDARLGRLYLPRAWMREAGLDPDAWLRAPTFSDALGSVVARLLKAADELYQRAELGIAALPRDCRPAIQAARLVYAEIGREVERAGCDSVSQRAVVSKNRKLALMARACTAALVLPGSARTAAAAPPALPAIQFLVDACVSATDAECAPVLVSKRKHEPRQQPVAQRAQWREPVSLAEPSAAPRRPLDERVDWTLSLFERLQMRQRIDRAFPGSGQPRPSVFSG